MPTFFRDLESYRQKAIPDLQPARERQKNYRAHPIDRTCPLYGDAVIDIRDFGIEERISTTGATIRPTTGARPVRSIAFSCARAWPRDFRPWTEDCGRLD